MQERHCPFASPQLTSDSTDGRCNHRLFCDGTQWMQADSQLESQTFSVADLVRDVLVSRVDSLYRHQPGAKHQKNGEAFPLPRDIHEALKQFGDLEGMESLTPCAICIAMTKYFLGEVIDSNKWRLRPLTKMYNPPRNDIKIPDIYKTKVQYLDRTEPLKFQQVRHKAKLLQVFNDETGEYEVYFKVFPARSYGKFQHEEFLDGGHLQHLEPNDNRNQGGLTFEVDISDDSVHIGQREGSRKYGMMKLTEERKNNIKQLFTNFLDANNLQGEVEDIFEEARCRRAYVSV